jgi:chemotaxis signal transduction protein
MTMAPGPGSLRPAAGGPRGALSAAQLRQEFDQAFARPVQAGAAPMEDHLAIRLRGDAHALRLDEVATLAPLGTLTRFPSPRPELLGVTGFRGAIVPVYDLRALLGYGAPDAPRWVVVAAAQPVALAFDVFEGHLRLPREARALEAPGQGRGPGAAAAPRRHVHEVLHAQGGVRPLVSIASVLDTIRGALPAARKPDMTRSL